MTAAELRPLEWHPAGWTTDDLDELPESNRRIELIDGALIVPPSPTNVHGTIALRLGSALEESCPAEYDITLGVEIRVSRIRSFIPDVLVAIAEAAKERTSKYRPADVVLAVEVVSPGSMTMDRITKPALYAEAGIPYFWRVENDPRIVVHTYRLDAATGVYRPTGEFAETVRTDEPWQIEFPITRIAPRYFPPQ